VGKLTFSQESAVRWNRRIVERGVDMDIGIGLPPSGCDELLMFLVLPDPGQVDLLAKAVQNSPVSTANNALMASVGR
jgi:hypothetical protein